MPRYRIKSLLTATAFFALTSSLLNSAIKQQRTIALIESKGGNVSVSHFAEYEESVCCVCPRGCYPLREFGENTIWKNLFQSVELVALPSPYIDEELCNQLNELHDLKVLYVGASTERMVRLMAARFPKLQITSIAPESECLPTEDQINAALKRLLQSRTL